MRRCGRAMLCYPLTCPTSVRNANATRGQIAKIDANAAGFSNTPSGQQFEDVGPGLNLLHIHLPAGEPLDHGGLLVWRSRRAVHTAR